MPGSSPAEQITNIASLFARSAERRPDAPAVVDATGTTLWTFGGLASEAARTAGGLRGTGLQPGDRVVILTTDRRDLLRVLCAAIWAGGTIVMPPGGLTLPAILRAMSASRPKAVVASPALAALAMPFRGLRSAPIRVVTGRQALPTWQSSAALDAPPIAPVAVAASGIAMHSFTTGSTGEPKPITRSHGVLAAQHEALEALRGLTEDDRDLAGIPMFALENLGAGVTTVLPPSMRGIHAGAAIRDAIARAHVTSAVGFPQMFEVAAVGAAPASLASLRAVHLGGSLVRPDLLASLSAAVPGVEATVVYGSTEVEPIASISAPEYIAHWYDTPPEDGTCVGTLIPGLEWRTAPVDGLTDPGDEGSRGRLLLRGARVAGSDPAVWLDTGDVARIDAESRVWLIGRVSNVATHLAPLAVERRAAALPWVERAACIAVTDGAGARRPVLVVQPRTWGSRDQRDAAQRDLLALAAPADDLHVSLVRRLPVLPGIAGKTDYQALARTHRSGMR